MAQRRIIKISENGEGVPEGFEKDAVRAYKNRNMTVAEYMRKLHKRIEDKHWQMKTECLDVNATLQLAEDLHKLNSLCRAFHTAEICKLLYSALNAAHRQLELLMLAITAMEKSVIRDYGEQRLNRLSLEMLSKYAEKPPIREQIVNIAAKTEIWKSAFEGDLLLDDVNEGLLEHVCSRVEDTVRVLKNASYWVITLLEREEGGKS